jgi:MFS family permease
MFIPSFFTGHVIARIGVERVMAIGLVILASAGLVALAGVQLENFYIALILLGIGWNFGFIGATTMLTGAHSVEERGRMQGLNDFLVFGGVTLAIGGTVTAAIWCLGWAVRAVRKTAADVNETMLHRVGADTYLSHLGQGVVLLPRRRSMMYLYHPRQCAAHSPCSPCAPESADSSDGCQ